MLNRVLDRSARRVEIGTPELQLEVQGAADGSAILELRGRLRVAPKPSTADATDARISLVAIDRKRSGFVEVPLTVQRRDLDFDLAATINIKKLMRSTPDLRSAQLQLRLDWENAHWNAEVSSAQMVAGPGVKQDENGVLTLRRVRAAGPPRPRPHHRHRATEPRSGRSLVDCGESPASSPAGTRARRAVWAVGICAPGGSLLS